MGPYKALKPSRGSEKSEVQLGARGGTRRTMKGRYTCRHSVGETAPHRKALLQRGEKTPRLNALLTTGKGAADAKSTKGGGEEDGIRTFETVPETRKSQRACSKRVVELCERLHE